MSLNYSKWDQLELSDDSDIEGHPNVDKRSLIRWKQRDIHQKREERKFRIGHLRAQIACNEVLLPRITAISNALEDTSSSTPRSVYFNGLVEQITTNPSRDCPPGNDPSKIEQTYDGMLLDLLRQVGEVSKSKIKDSGILEAEKEERLAKALAAGMKEHVQKLGETIENDKKELEKEEKEQKKHITSDDIHEGFENKYVPPPPVPPPVPTVKPDKGKKKVKETTTEVEVLNPGKTSSAAPADPGMDDSDDDDEGLPQLTPALEAFSKIPVGRFQQSYEFIQSNRGVMVKGASDALLVAAFQAQSNGNPKLARQCVHQSLLIQYCEKLGADGVRVFFRKMVTADKRAEAVFVDDFEKTYNHLAARVEASKQEEDVGTEQIQLVPENPDQVISFNVPDGPPPENLVLEGPGTEELDVEEVRKALQLRWDVFEAFPLELQEALKEGTLEGVNKVLGGMDVEQAEAVVQSLDIAGILNFADGGIRDETPAGRASA